MMKLFKILFFNSMIIGTFIAISSYSWLSSWIGLEINLLSLIPLLKNHKNKFPSESAIKYFIIQVIGSSILLFSIIVILTMKYMLTMLTNSLELIILSSALLMKMGAAPFHSWFPEVMSGLNWNNAFIMLTWQKIAPMILLTYQIKFYTLFFSIIIITSSMISGIQGLNQISMLKIMAYSSINHMSWMMSTILSSINIFYYYFLIYSFINLSIILMLKKYNIKFINQLSNTFSLNKNMKFLFMINFLSLGGLPPFLGFLPKWLTINEMINNNNYFITTILIIFTLITLYFYLRITFSSFMIYTSKSLFFLMKKNYYFQLITNMISITGLLSCSLISNFM